MPSGSYIWDRETMTFRPRAEMLRKRAEEAAQRRSDLPMPMVINDTLDDCVHPANGQRYSSKAKFREETRARGLTEMGNEAFPVKRQPTEAETRQEIQREIAEAYSAIEQGAEVAPAKVANTEIIKPELAKAIDV